MSCPRFASIIVAGFVAAGGGCSRYCPLYSGFILAEGPAADPHGNLYFTDQNDRPGKIYRVDPAGRLCLFNGNSNRAHGLKINAQGEIVACQISGQVVAFSPDGSSCRVLTSSYQGRRYNAPNDLVIDRCGGIYFTDPFYDAPRPAPQGVEAVYYIAPSGQVTRLIDNLLLPNGITLSPDGNTLYVVPSLERHVVAYPVLAPGLLGPGRQFCRLVFSGLPFFPVGDGCTVDACGNLYVATFSGVQVFDPCGGMLDFLCVPERVTNVAFGGPDRRTLFITAGHSLYAARSWRPGVVPAWAVSRAPHAIKD